MFLFLGTTFTLGLFVGSFLNVIIYRLHSGEQFVRGRSHCPHCSHTLSWYELIPLASFAVQQDYVILATLENANNDVLTGANDADGTVLGCTCDDPDYCLQP